MGLRNTIKYISLTGSASVVNIFISIIRTKFIAVLIGPTGIAVVGQLTNLTNIAGFFSTLGLQQGLINEVAKAKLKNDPGFEQQLKMTFFLVLTWLSFIVSLVIFFLSDHISQWIFDTKEFTTYVKIVSLFTFATGFITVYQTFFSVHRLYKEVTVASIVANVLSVIISIILIIMLGLNGAVIGISTSGIIQVITFLIFSKRSGLPVYLDKLFLLKFFRSEIFRSLFFYGSILMTSSIIFQVVHLQIKNFIIEQDGFIQAGYYQAAVSMSKQYMPIFLAALSTYLLPQISNRKSLLLKWQEVDLSLKALFILATPVLVLLSALSNTVVTILYSEEFRLTGSLLSILIISDFLGIVNKVYYLLVLTVRKMQYLLILDVITAVFMYSFTIFNYAELGLYAPVYASVGASVIFFISTSVFFYSKWKLKLSRNNIFFLLFSLLVLFVLAHFIEEWIHRLLFAVFTLSLLYVISFSKKEKQQLLNKVRSIFKK